MNVAYIRVSTSAQVDAYGLGAQADDVRAWSVARGIDVRIFTEPGVSGAIEDRPVLAQAIDALGEGDVFVVPRLDRLARDLMVQEFIIAEVRRRGACVASCDAAEDAYLGDGTDPTRTLIRQLLGAFAQYERAMIALRTQAGKAAKAAAGGYVGGQPPYGWTGRGGELVERDDEQRILARIEELGSLPSDQIADLLNAQGYRTRTGKRWTARTVRHVTARVHVVS